MSLKVKHELDSPHYQESVRTDPLNPWQPRQTCPACGSEDVRIGCPYQDCEECSDVESLRCRSCGTGWGGADYWTPGTSTGILALDLAAAEAARMFKGPGAGIA